MRMRSQFLRSSTVSVAFVLGACAGQSVDQTHGPAATADPNDPIARIEANEKPLAAQCVFDKTAGAMTVAVATGETANVTMRSADKAILVNGLGCTSDAGTTNYTGTQITAVGSGTTNVLKLLTITGTSGGTNTAMIDFTNGLFAVGAGTATTGIVIDLKGDAADSLVVSGTAGNDVVTVGALGVSVDNPKKLDISFLTGVGKLYFSLGDGNDLFSAGGDTVAGGASNTAYVAAAVGGLQVFGGAGNDTINEGAAQTKYELVSGGAGIDTVDYGSRTAAVGVTLGSAATAMGLVVRAGTSTAGITLTGTASKAVSLKVKVSTAGANLAASPKLDISIDGGVSWAQTAVTAAATVAVTGTGLTLAIADGTFVLNDTWTAQRGTDGEALEADDIQGDVEIVNGGAGNDTLSGYQDNSLTQGNAAYTLNGGAGDDWFLQTNFVVDKAPNATEVLNGGAGTNTVDYSNRNSSLVITMDGLAANDGDPDSTQNSATGEKDNVGKDIQNVLGGSAGDTITGGAANNAITGGGGSDSLVGGDGDDVFFMGSSKVSAGGGDTIVGGLGRDTVDYGARTDFGVTVTLDGATGSGATGQSEGDVLDCENANGSLTLASKLIGNAGANELVGGAGVDSLDGGGGDDVLDGGSGGGVVDLFACGAGFDVVVEKNAGVNKASDFTTAATDCEIF